MQSTACSPISSEFRFKANTIEIKTNKTNPNLLTSYTS